MKKAVFTYNSRTQPPSSTKEIIPGERQMLYALTYLKKWYKWTYLQNRNRLTDTENKLKSYKRVKGGETGSMGLTDAHQHIKIE